MVHGGDGGGPSSGSVTVDSCISLRRSTNPSLRLDDGSKKETKKRGEVTLVALPVVQ